LYGKQGESSSSGSSAGIQAIPLPNFMKIQSGPSVFLETRTCGEGSRPGASGPADPANSLPPWAKAISRPFAREEIDDFYSSLILPVLGG
jgi:hypothetical protein